MKNMQRISRYIKYAAATVVLCGGVMAASAQQLFVIEQADLAFSKRDYAKAVPIYEELGATRKGEIYTYKAALCYWKMRDYDKAAETFANVVGNPKVPHDAHMYYGKVLLYQSKYKEAKEQFKLFQSGNPQSGYENLTNYIASCDYGIEHMNDSSDKYTIAKHNLQTNAFYLGGSNFQDDYFFYGKSAAGPNAKKPSYFFSLVDLGGDSVINGNTYSDSISTRFYLGYPSFTKDYYTMYYTKNESDKETATRNQYRNAGISSDGINTLNIYQATLVDGKWSSIRPISINSNEYSDTHPFITPDGKRLYFSSNRPGGYGGYDLYYCVKDNDNWSEPVNLGPNINTWDDEMNPFVLNDTALYFSSNGHVGFGGADIFVSSGNESRWSAPRNLGKGFNSSRDDFGIFLSPDGRKGYFASNRVSAMGVDDFYTFEKSIEYKSGSGLVIDKLYNNRLEGATLEVYENDSLVGQINSNLLGSFTFNKFDPEKKYLLIAQKNGYITQEKRVDPQHLTTDDLTFIMQPVIDENAVFTFNDILFEYNKADLLPESMLILDRLASVLAANPNVVVELSAHTDSRGTDSYNLKLSQKRAESSVNYLIAKGIDSDRLIARGYGETKLKNHCTNGVKCSEEEHQENRRVEIRAIKMRQNKAQ